MDGVTIGGLSKFEGVLSGREILETEKNNATTSITTLQIAELGAQLVQPLLNAKVSTSELAALAIAALQPALDLKLSRADAAAFIGTLALVLSRPMRPAQYTLATLPAAADWNGCEIDVIDAAGGVKRCVSNGTNWKILNTSTTVS